MQFVALLSGGKDSCYNALKCVERGHKLVCLANLMPPEDFQGEELNSYMYQSAAFSVIPSMAECFEVPLIRRQISGSALVKTLDYEAPDVLVEGTELENRHDYANDEVEDLYQLLLDVKMKYPGIQGVSCGCIVSTYQRLRLEHVCRRPELQLTPLCYLWMRDRKELLFEMIDLRAVSHTDLACEATCDAETSVQYSAPLMVPDLSDQLSYIYIDAVLVKVAGAGLDPRKHLGLSLQRLRPTLLRLHDTLGLDLCGEGGEYESIVLDCPLFPHKRLCFDQTDVLVDSENDSVGNLRVLRCRIEDKPQALQQAHSAFRARKSTLYNEMLSSADEFYSKANSGAFNKLGPWAFAQFAAAASAASAVVPCNPPRWTVESVQPADLTLVRSTACAIQSDGLGQTGLIYGCNSSSTKIASDMQMLLRHQILHCWRSVQTCVEAVGGTIRDVCFVHLYLKDMASFASANDAYVEALGAQLRNPPSRCCVAVPLPSDCEVAMDATFYIHSYARMQSFGVGGRSDGAAVRSVLHVRSISDWAPMCIGPYSQANTLADAMVLAAGQIPLDPGTMSLLPDSSAATTGGASSMFAGLPAKLLPQLLLSLRHAQRVLEASGGTLHAALLVTVYVNIAAMTDSPASHGQLSRIFICAMQAFVSAFLATNGKCSPADAKKERSEDALVSDSDADGDSSSVEWEHHSGQLEHALALPAVVVIGVSGLPKNAAFEVEIAAATTALPAAAYSEHNQEGIISEIRLPLSAQSIEPALPVYSWPIWGLQSTSTALPEPAPMPSPVGQDCAHWATPPAPPAREISRNTPLHFDAHYKFTRRTTCAGSVIITHAAQANLNPSVDLAKAVRGVVAAILKGLQTAYMSAEKLLSVRLYYVPTAQDDLHISLTSAYTAAAREYLFPNDLRHAAPVSIIPVAQLPSILVMANEQDDAHTVLLAHFWAVDLVQHATEQWILGAKNFNDSSGK